MERRLFYNLEIRAQREMADVDYTNREPIDEKPIVGVRIVLDTRLATHGAKAKALIIDQLLKSLDDYYAKNA